MGKYSGFVLCTLRNGSPLCSVGNTWPIGQRSHTEFDVHFTFENILIVISSSSVTIMYVILFNKLLLYFCGFENVTLLQCKYCATGYVD